MTASSPRNDAFSELLGIEVQRLGPGHATATLVTSPSHGNPHGTVHGALTYAVAGAAIAAAANDDAHSGIMSSVVVDYLQAVPIGSVLQAEVSKEASTPGEDIFTGSVRCDGRDEIVAWVRARGTRRSRRG